MRFLPILFFLCIYLQACDAQKVSTPSHKDAKPVVYINPEAKITKGRIRVPNGFIRSNPNKNSFAYYLQNFSLKPDESKVHYYNGQAKHTQTYHAAILDIDVGTRDLQQCADAVMRLRAEYLYQQHEYDDIQFHFTNGFLADYATWRAGQCIKVTGNEVRWYESNKESKSYTSFRKYLDIVFSYAGTLSLSKELKEKSIQEMKIGDVFIQGGSPGHAVLIVDMAVHEESGEKIFLIAQSYMPAQDIHILNNEANSQYGPWYSVLDIKSTLRTPEWTFQAKDLKSFDTN